MIRSILEIVQSFAAKRALGYLDSDPDSNIPRLLAWVDRFDRKNEYAGVRSVLHGVIDNPDNNWFRYIKSFYSDVDAKVRKKLFENLIVNAFLIGDRRQRKAMRFYKCSIPWAILMDPTSACNLRCAGRWATEYGGSLSMDYATMDSIVRQGKAVGTYMYIFSGGEPLVRKKDILRLCAAHPDAEFLAFTNATLIDEDFAREMLRVKNFVPAISVEGFEEETDARRGAGAFKAALKAMEILKRQRLVFGVSCCYTSENTETVGSEEYYDFIIERGAKFAWFFTYIPVGKNAVTSLIASAQQREYMYRQVRNFRKTKPLFTLDFWNDGEYSNGCIAGGRSYLHINANGDVEPCAFIHYSDSNIHEKTLIEACRSPLFMAFREGQPFNSNHLKPCPLLDNPGALADVVTKSGAKSTDLACPEDVHCLTEKCRAAAESWSPVAERLWESSGRAEYTTKR